MSSRSQRSSGNGPGEEMACTPYRSDKHVFEAIHVEERELREHARDARLRRLRPAVVLGGLFLLFIAGLLARDRLPGEPARLETGPRETDPS
jgi:hypothetical protein